MNRILLTGFNGFVGRHCSAALREKGYEVLGLTNSDKGKEHFHEIVNKAVVCDLSDESQLDEVDFSDVSGVINLAGIATNTADDGDYIKRVNIGVHVNLYRHFERIGIMPRILAVSSGAVYDQDQTMPETEESRLKNVDAARPYEASKIEMERALGEFATQDIVVVRPFNHIGPGQNGRFIVPDLAKGISEALASGSLAVPVGNLASRRDYTDVRDVVRAYISLLELERPIHRVYNVCSGTSWSGQEIFDALAREFGAESLMPETDQTRLRGASDDSTIVGSSERLRQETGWQPAIGFDTTIRDYVTWFKQQ